MNRCVKRTEVLIYAKAHGTVTVYIHVTWQTCLGNPRQQSDPGISDLETHIDYTGQMFYERFQNLDLDKAELEVFKLFLDSIVLFVDRGPVRIGVCLF